MSIPDHPSPIRQSERQDVATGICCDLLAIPADERGRHIALARSLIGGGAQLIESAEGYVIQLPVERLDELMSFMRNERRCCAHLGFRLDVPAAGAAVTLRVTGPGALDQLKALAGSTHQEQPIAT
jgi:hypothetical protein